MTVTEQMQMERKPYQNPPEGIWPAVLVDQYAVKGVVGYKDQLKDMIYMDFMLAEDAGTVAVQRDGAEHFVHFTIRVERPVSKVLYTVDLTKRDEYGVPAVVRYPNGLPKVERVLYGDMHGIAKLFMGWLGQAYPNLEQLVQDRTQAILWVKHKPSKAGNLYARVIDVKPGKDGVLVEPDAGYLRMRDRDKIYGRVGDAIQKEMEDVPF